MATRRPKLDQTIGLFSSTLSVSPSCLFHHRYTILLREESPLRHVEESADILQTGSDLRMSRETELDDVALVLIPAPNDTSAQHRAFKINDKNIQAYYISRNNS